MSLGDTAAIIPAAGQGKRMGLGINKQFLMLEGRPVLAHTLQVFENEDEIAEIVVVAHSQEIAKTERLVADYGFTKVKKVVTGGAERQHSVYQGLLNISPFYRWVVVHDGARPLLSSELLRATLSVARQHGAAIAAVPVKDTIKKVVDQTVSETLDRAKLWAVQTPQAFAREVLKTAYDRAFQAGLIATDDAALVEKSGYQVQIVSGNYENIKITTPEDLEIAKIFLNRRD